MSNLVNFLKNMGQDADLRERYVQDPDGTMAAEGLTAEEAEAVKTGDVDKIRELAGSDANNLGFIFCFMFSND